MPSALLQVVSVIAGFAGVSLYLERRFARINRRQDRADRKLDVISAVLIADCKTNPEIDEERVAEALTNNGMRPEDFLTKKKKNGKIELSKVSRSAK